MTDHPESDLLSSLIGRIGQRGRLVVRPQLCGDWRLNDTGLAQAAFHLVAAGEVWLHLRAAEPQRLATGDLLFLPRDTWHVLAASPGLDGEESRLPAPDGAPSAELVCGLYQGADAEFARLLLGLPDLLLIRAGDGGRQIAVLVELLLAEDPRAPGATAMLGALSDMLLVQLLRCCLARRLIQGGLLAALADRRLAPVLAAMHADPGGAGSLPELAARAALSRSAFAARFQRLLGVSPGQYLAELRMAEAQRLLRDADLSVVQIGERVGYATEAAFRRAFRRIIGVPPGALRGVRTATPISDRD